MPQKPELVEEEIYHIYNRGIDGKVVFPTDEYYERFLLGLKLFNTTDPVQIRDVISSTEVKPQSQWKQRLVDVGLINLRPTHYHLLLRQLIPGGVSLLMQKLGTGFTMFFNLKNFRSGSLFQGTFKAKLVDKDQYLKHLFAYIVLNSLDSDMPEWRNGGVSDRKKAEEFLINAKWSNFGSLFKDNQLFEGIVSRDFIKEFFDDTDELKDFILSWSEKESDLVKEIVAG